MANTKILNSVKPANQKTYLSGEKINLFVKSRGFAYLIVALFVFGVACFGILQFRSNNPIVQSIKEVNQRIK